MRGPNLRPLACLGPCTVGHAMHVDYLARGERINFEFGPRYLIYETILSKITFIFNKSYLLEIMTSGPNSNDKLELIDD